MYTLQLLHIFPDDEHLYSGMSGVAKLFIRYNWNTVLLYNTGNNFK